MGFSYMDCFEIANVNVYPNLLSITLLHSSFTIILIGFLTPYEMTLWEKFELCIILIYDCKTFVSNLNIIS